MEGGLNLSAMILELDYCSVIAGLPLVENDL